MERKYTKPKVAEEKVAEEKVERVVGLKMPDEDIRQIDEMAAQQMRNRSNMLRVLIHLGMQSVSADAAFAAEAGLSKPGDVVRG